MLVIVAALVLAFLAFKFVRGATKFAIIIVLALLVLFIAHETGAF